MKRMLAAVLLTTVMITGCARNHFNVPIDKIAEKIKVLGVIPIVVDADSDIRHPQKDQLVQIVTDMNRKYEQQFVRRVKGTGNFYTVALMDGDPQKIFRNLLSRRELRDDATIRYNKYYLKTEELRDYITKNKLDAAMLIVVSGLTANEKVYSSDLLTYLTSDYNFLTITAQIFDQNGVLLWEYPNFRRRFLSYYPMINLQYPDFSEAEANLSGKTHVKFKTLDGLLRSLDKKRKDLFLRETQDNEVYGKQFDEMMELLKYDTDVDKKTAAPSAERPSAETMQPAVSAPHAAAGVLNPPAVSESQPAATSANLLVEPPVSPAVEGQKLPDSDVIVPATGSTL